MSDGKLTLQQVNVKKAAVRIEKDWIRLSRWTPAERMAVIEEIINKELSKPESSNSDIDQKGK